MKPFTFSEYSNEWLKVFRAMFPGGSTSPVKEATPAAPTAQEALAAEKQKWEGEGGNLKPEKK